MCLRRRFQPLISRTFILTLAAILNIGVRADDVNGSAQENQNEAEAITNAPSKPAPVHRLSPPERKRSPSAKEDRPFDEKKDKLYLPRPLAEILRLVKAGVEDDVIVAYINKAPYDYRLTPGQIVTLSDLGISSRLITAMLEHRPTTGLGVQVTSGSEAKDGLARPLQGPPPPTSIFIPGAPPLPADASFADFFSALAPYGQWFNVPGLGWCWQPNVAVMNSDWQPYADNGYWIWSDNGWYWNSCYPWGWAPFHYGRWTRRDHLGWLWRPDTDWSPAWVSWRRNRDYRGWAPLPPEASFGMGGWTFNGAQADENSSFDLPWSDFIFVPHAHFAERDWGQFRLDSDAARELFDNMAPQNLYAIGRNRHVVNWAVGDRDQAPTVRPVPVIDRTLSAVGAGGQLAANSDAEAMNPAQLGMYSDAWTAFNGAGFGTPAAGDEIFSSGGGFVDGGGGGGGFSGDSGFWAEGGDRRRGHRRPVSNSGLTGTGIGLASLASNPNPTPWLPYGTQAASGDREPWGVYGSNYQPPSNADPWLPFGGTAQQGGASAGGGAWDTAAVPNIQGRLTSTGSVRPGANRELAMNRNFGQNMDLASVDVSSGRDFGNLGHGTIGRGVFGRLPMPQPAVGGPAWGVFGQGGAAGGPVYGVPGVPIVPNDGTTPWLPFGTQPMSGNAAPYGTFGLANQPSGVGSVSAYMPFSAGSVVPRYGSFDQVQGGGFRYLPGAPILPASPMLPGGPYLPGSPLLPNAPIWPSFAYLGRWPSAPNALSAPSTRSAMSAMSAMPSRSTASGFGHRGFGGGGFHGMGGAGTGRAAGGGARIGGGGARGGGGGGGGGHR